MLGAQPIPRPGSPAPRLRPWPPGLSAPAATCSEGAGASAAAVAAPELRAPRPAWLPFRRAHCGAPRRASQGRARHPNFPFWAIFLPEPGSKRAHSAQLTARTGSRHPPHRAPPTRSPRLRLPLLPCFCPRRRPAPPRRDPAPVTPRTGRAPACLPLLSPLPVRAGPLPPSLPRPSSGATAPQPPPLQPHCTPQPRPPLPSSP